MKEKPKRLDRWLVEKHYFATRAKAQEALKRGHVRIANMERLKASMPAPPDLVEIDIAPEATSYVSRAAFKLLAGIENFAPAIKGKTILDIGASTGGFTQVLLLHGAAHVIAVDVGHNQLAPSLLNHPRVTLHEGVNARYLDESLVASPVDGVVMDVSFISLKLAAPPALALTKRGGFALLLVKPQFEVGPSFLTKQGLVVSSELAEQTAYQLKEWLEEQGSWGNCRLCKSPLRGKEGNQEFLLYAEKIKQDP